MAKNNGAGLDAHQQEFVKLAMKIVEAASLYGFQGLL